MSRFDHDIGVAYDSMNKAIRHMRMALDRPDLSSRQRSTLNRLIDEAVVMVSGLDDVHRDYEVD